MQPTPLMLQWSTAQIFIVCAAAVPGVELANPGTEVRRDVVAQLRPLGDVHPVVDAVDVLHKVLPPTRKTWERQEPAEGGRGAEGVGGTNTKPTRRMGLESWACRAKLERDPFMSYTYLSASQLCGVFCARENKLYSDSKRVH